MAKDPILSVKNLRVSFHTYAGEVQAVRGMDFDLREGETLAIVGESGSGKSVTTRAVMGLIPKPPGEIKDGEILYKGKNIINYKEKEMQKLRGKEISMIFQDPMSALNPTMKVGAQIVEGLKKHQKLTSSQAKERAIELLRLVGIPYPEKRIDQFPHQFSGGMRQRVVIAIALACDPKVLIADEPTTALDVTIQAQILELMNDLKEKLGTAIVLITHDLGVVANMADRVIVMYGGQVAETGTVDEIFYQPKHPYTWGLLSSMPNPNMKEEVLQAIPGSPPDLSDPPVGCPFAARCPYAMKVCVDHNPALEPISETQKAACWLNDERSPKVEPPERVLAGGGSTS
ncbi:ABC transporter ATP-binding protein [Aureibacillus halotolerans]|uniref:Oligopeptide transport system ATP-binding protein n=1 Tax=Aureibacillus halotolerans TaxID=1508390 RepID=A0A4R6UDF1_9BACI|nr:ABC transporter ATP-binding protein [Aureibacillus halotolerans]TDQ42815.1 oligopeptide transport system ATP-binding protein [Aureibacillus halotolerans]